MDQPEREKATPGRFGVNPSLLQKAAHFRDVVFPQAGVSLFLDEGKAYAVTSEREIVYIAHLETLDQMADPDVLAVLDQVVKAQRQGRNALLELRVRARFLTQESLASYINAMYDSPPLKPVMSAKTIWRAENGQPIAETTAWLIVTALKDRDVEVRVDQVDWIIGHQGKRRNRGVASPPPEE